MALGRDDRWLADAQGRALAGAKVYWCYPQPATTPSTPPPSPLMTVYADIGGTVPITQPVITDGFGHCEVYLTTGVLYTVVMYHILFGEFPVILPDQELGGGSSGASITTFAGIPQGVIDGVNTQFTLVNGATPLTAIPSQMTAWLNYSLIPSVGYSVGLSGGVAQIVYSTPPQPAAGGAPADTIYAQGIFIV